LSDITQNGRYLIDEITLYIPNVPGQLSRALKALAEAGINLIALSVEHAGVFSTVRLIPDDIERAEIQLQKHAFGLSKTKILAIAIPDKPGGLQYVTELFAANGINIDYAYVAMPRKTGEAVILVKANKEGAREVLIGKGFRDLHIHDLEIH
jgi:hypothetical protein